MIGDFKDIMMKEFEMTDLDLMSYFLGIKVIQGDDEIFNHQRKFTAEFLKKFKMEDSNPIKTPIETGIKLTKEGDGRTVDATYFKQIVGSLRYLMCIRPDICYVVGLVSRYMESPQQVHLQVVKRIMRYIKGTATFGLFYSSSKKIEIIGYSDSDWGGDSDERKSTSGHCFMIEKTVCLWSSKKQSIVALSTCEAKYVAAARAC
ncbi:secreted RxLR effector protein 161-like [Phaseolus vulgaris]|uniref:secreted RxLR effector protein 161-like n=1 Tax=Phaseolus vulgaris TaxID=3885 RepID=UPI0035CB6069